MPPSSRERAGIDAVEALEHARQVLRRDAGAGVRDRRRAPRRLLGCRAHAHRGAFGTVLERVVDEVAEHVLERAPVGPHARTRRAHRVTGRCASPARGGRAGEIVRSTTARRSSGSISSFSSRDSMRESSSRSSIRLRQPLGVALDQLDEALRRLCASFSTVAQRLRGRAHGRERAAQLVRRVRDEIAPDRFQPAQLGHVDEHREHAARCVLAASRPAPARAAASGRPDRSRPRSALPRAAFSSSWLRSALRTTCSTDLPDRVGADQQHRAQRRIGKHDAPVAADDQHAFVHARQDAGEKVALGAQFVEACARGCLRAGRAPARAPRSRRDPEARVRERDVARRHLPRERR